MGYASNFSPYLGLGYAGVKGFNHYLQSQNPRFGKQGSGMTQGYSNRQVVASKRGRGRSNTFAAKVRNLSGYKHNTQSSSSVSSTMTHQTIYTSNMTALITQGDGNTNRDGDGVHLTALKVKGVIHTAAASGAFCYRVLVGWSGEEYNVTGSNAGLTSTELFLPSQGGAFFVTANVNPKAFTCIHDELIDINSLIATTADLKTIAFNVKINQKFLYQASASTFGKTRNLYVVVIGGVVGGTSGTTSCGSFFFDTDLVFQDMK